MKMSVNVFLCCVKKPLISVMFCEKSKRQRYLYQGSITAAAALLLTGTGAAGIQINKITVFCTPDIFPERLCFGG
jgi:hypothetical protein